MEELKPCPFCGRETANFMWDNDPFEEDIVIRVVCNSCGARTADFLAYGEHTDEGFWEQLAAYRAMDAWNRRA